MERALRLLNLACVMLVLPPVWITLRGGADLDAWRWRFTWYEPGLLWVGLLAALLGILAPVRSDLRYRVGLLVGLLAIGASVSGYWLGRPPAPGAAWHWTAGGVIVGLVAIITAGYPTTTLRRRALGLTPLVFALCSGTLLTLGLYAADREHLTRSIARAADSSPASESDPGDVILIVVDTLRADALGTYGGAESATPFLDSLAAESVVFDRAITQAPWTFPAMASLMTSLYPSSLGLNRSRKIYENVIDGDLIWAGNSSLHIPEAAPRLARSFRAAGYITVGIQKSPLLFAGSGFEAGFDLYEPIGGFHAERTAGAELVDATLRWASVFRAWRDRNPDEPFFLYLHFMDPHLAYDPPQEFLSPEARRFSGPTEGSGIIDGVAVEVASKPHPEALKQLRQLYDGEVRYIDHELSRLGSAMRELDLWSEDTTVVVVGDHGEQFGEHGGFEHRDIQIENVWVPLIVKAPGFEPRRVTQPVRLMDVAPTLIELKNLEAFAQSDGRSLVPAMRGEGLPELDAITEYETWDRVTGRRHSILVRGRKVSLFDLAADPKEQNDLFGAPVKLEGDLSATLREHRARTPPSFERDTKVDEEYYGKVLEGLRALGYIDR